MGQKIYRSIFGKRRVRRKGATMLNVISTKEAIETVQNNVQPDSVGTLSVPLTSCIGRKTASDIISDEFIPPFSRSTVDGFAVSASDTYGSSESIPAMLNLKGEILMGEKADAKINKGECIRISTGGMLPEGADSVVMLEYTQTDFDGLCLVFKAVGPFENVTKKGDDIIPGKTIIKKGTVLSSKHIGILASLGINEVECVRKPVVAVISTGDELIPITEKPTDGKIRNINSAMLSAFLSENGCDILDFGIIRDNKEAIEKALQNAAKQSDVILLSGGSSAGARDLTAEIISENGSLLFHGISMKPGKPTIFGNCFGKPVFGLPGHPTAAYFVSVRVVLPLLEKLGAVTRQTGTETAVLSCNLPSNHGREEIVCVKLENGKATPIFGKSGIISLLSESDGYVIIDRNCEGLKTNEKVTVNLF